jgi:hypothetical protein
MHTNTSSTNISSPYYNISVEGQFFLVQYPTYENARSNTTGLTTVYSHCLVFHVLYLQMGQLGWCWAWFSSLYPLYIYSHVFRWKDKVTNKLFPEFKWVILLHKTCALENNLWQVNRRFLFTSISASYARAFSDPATCISIVHVWCSLALREASGHSTIHTKNSHQLQMGVI